MNLSLIKADMKTRWMNIIAALSTVSLMQLIMHPIAFADSTAHNDAPSVGGNGDVTIKGKGNNAQQGVTSLFGKAQFWIGVVAGVAGLILLVYGIWLGAKAARAIQKGDQAGWGSIGYVVGGTVIGGIFLVVIGSFLAIGSATGTDLF